MKKEIKSLIEKYKEEVTHIESKYQFGRHGEDDGGWHHGKRDTLDDVIEALEGLLWEPAAETERDDEEE